MKQILQNLRSGETLLTEVPAPGPGRGTVLIQTRASLISAGTERMLVEFGKASLLGKARSQPEKVKQVLDKIRSDGLLPTLEAVFNRLDEPLPLGYCNAGVVLEVSPGVTEFSPGDRVASNGPHAEIVCVPKNLCAKVPDEISDEQAAFTVLSSIGLQGMRLLDPTLGERFAVFGLGLIGLVTVQLLRSNGCSVLGIDVHPGRLALAERFGAVVVNAAAGGDPIAAASAWTEGRGVDGVLITASAKDDAIVHQSAQMCRKRGRIVLVGVVELALQRSDFYEKELSFQVSCSYGPGRYDEKYEQGGQDYPCGFVRWTERRNFEAILDLLKTGRLAVDDLITHRFPIADAPQAYEKVSTDRNALGVILQYSDKPDLARTLRLRDHQITGLQDNRSSRQWSVDRGRGTQDRGQKAEESGQTSVICHPSSVFGQAVIGVIGAGNFAKMTLMPALAKTSARIKYVCDLNGAAAAHLARKFRGEIALTDYSAVLADPEVNAVIIAVGHNLHARLVCEAGRAGKHTLVEKPLAMSVEEVRKILEAYQRTEDGRQKTGGSGQPGEIDGPVEQSKGSTGQGQSSRASPREISPTISQGEEDGSQKTDSQLSTLNSQPGASLLMVGFNRRFSPHAVRIKELLAGRSEPLAMTMTVNAGAIPPEHWVQNPERGGGRIIGEACHFIDLMVFLSGSLVRTVAAVMMSNGVAVKEDKMSISLGFEDGSIGTINYFANGSKAYPKELMEVFSEGRVVRLENFRKTTGFGFRGFKRLKTWRQDKGHSGEFAAFVDRVKAGGPPLISLPELVNVTLASFAAMTAASETRVVVIAEEYAL